MTALNNEISNVGELNENYHIGVSYFLKLKYLTFNKLWTDYLQPLLPILLAISEKIRLLSVISHIIGAGFHIRHAYYRGYRALQRLCIMIS